MSSLIKQFRRSKMVTVTEEEAKRTFLSSKPMYNGEEVVVVAVAPTYKGNLIIEYLSLKDYENIYSYDPEPASTNRRIFE